MGAFGVGSSHSLQTRSILFIVTTLREDLEVFTIQDIQELKQAFRVSHMAPQSVMHISTLSRYYSPNSLRTSSQSPNTKPSPSSRMDSRSQLTWSAGKTSHGPTTHWLSKPQPPCMPPSSHIRITSYHSAQILLKFQPRLSLLRPLTSSPGLMCFRPLSMQSLLEMLSALPLLPPLLIDLETASLFLFATRLLEQLVHLHHPYSTTLHCCRVATH